MRSHRLSLTRVAARPAEAAAGQEAAGQEEAAGAGPARTPGWRLRARPAAAGQQIVAGSRSVAALGGAALILLGAVPMAVAQASPNADPILAQSIAGSSAPVDNPAPGFALTDQNGRTVSLASLRGKVVLLSFLNPACTPGCPAIGLELRQAASMLGASAHQVELVGIVLSPADRSVSDLRAFDRREGLNRVPDWLYLTGTPWQLQRVWREYGITAQNPAAEAASHGEAYVIDRAGHVRQKYSTAAGPGTAATRSSFAVLFTDAARQQLS